MPFDSADYVVASPQVTLPVTEGHRRLLVLAEFLETKVPATHFEMKVFGRAIKNGEIACGTAACAAGWGASIPSFRRAGYHLEYDADDSWVRPSFKGASGFDALEKFFGISEEEAEFLFDSAQGGIERSNDPKDAAARIRSFVAEHQAS